MTTRQQKIVTFIESCHRDTASDQVRINDDVFGKLRGFCQTFNFIIVPSGSLKTQRFAIGLVRRVKLKVELLIYSPYVPNY